MNTKTRRLLAICLIFPLAGTATPAAAETLGATKMVVKLIHERDVPARETGLLLDVGIREGSSVKRGQILGKLDDRKAKLEEQLAGVQTQVAEKQAESNHALKMARQDSDQQQEMDEQQKLLTSIAHRKAENRVRVLAAEKAQAVAKNELARATRARAEFADAVSISEIDGLRLAHERSQLEAQQAEFEREIDALNAKSEDRASRIQAISVQQSKIAVEQAGLDQEIAKLQAIASRHSAKLSTLSVQRHQVISPISGTVVHVYKQPGEWVTAGDPIARIVHLDRLRAEGFVRTRHLQQLKSLAVVKLVRYHEDGSSVTKEGEIVFISPEVDPVNDEVAFWAEFDNEDHAILPGMQMELVASDE